MPGLNGLSARQLPIASPDSKSADIHGFCRRRFDLFAINQVALQSRVRGFLLWLVSGHGELWVVIGTLAKHRPGDARRLVGQSHCRDIGVAALGDIGHPTAEGIIAVPGL